MASDASPWKLGGLTVKELAVRVYNEFQVDELSDRAAALSYYFLFSLFPSLLFLVALIGVLPIPDLMNQFMGYTQRVLPGDSASLVQRTLDEIVRGSGGGLLSVGALTALWAGSAGMASVMSALSVAYDVEDVRPWWKRRLLAILLTIGFALFIIAALVFMVFGPKLGGALAGWLGLGGVFTAAWNIASVPLAVVFVLLAFALVYYLAPASEQSWRWVTPGSATAVALWLLVSFGLRLYVTNFANYNATYGSIGGVILLMLWLYLTGLVLLLGAEVNAVIEHAAAERGAAGAKARGERHAGEREPAGAERGARELAAPGLDRRARDRPAQRRAAPARPAESVAAGVAARVIAEQVQTARQRGWIGLFGLAAGAALGWMMSRRPVSEVRTTAERGLQVASTIAAAERLRTTREQAKKAA